MKAKIDLGKYKKVTDHPHYAVLEHPEGHQIKIVKNRLSKELAQNLKSIPMAHFAYGGEVEDQTESAIGQEINRSPASEEGGFVGKSEGLQNPEQLQDEIKQQEAEKEIAARQAKRPSMMSMLEQAEPAPSVKKGPEIKEEPKTEQVKPSNYQLSEPEKQGPDALAQAQMYNPYEQAMNLGTMGALAQYEADKQYGAASGRAAKDQVAANQETLRSYQEQQKNLNEMISSTIDDIKTGQINPNHYWESMNTGQKIVNAIGIIASSLSGTDVGSKYLEAQIGRDIEAQKANLGKKETILSALYKQTGNLNEATKMATLIQGEIYKDKLQQAIASNSNPQAKANLMKSLADLNSKLAPGMQQIAMQNTLRSLSPEALRAHGPEQIAQLVVPKEERAGAAKELSEWKAMDGIKNIYKRDFDAIHNSFLNGVASPIDTQARKQALLAVLQKELSGRFNLEEAKVLADTLYPNKFEFDSTSNAKRQRALDIMQTKIQTPILTGAFKNAGINPAVFGMGVTAQFNPRGR